MKKKESINPNGTYDLYLLNYNRTKTEDACRVLRKFKPTQAFQLPSMINKVVAINVPGEKVIDYFENQGHVTFGAIQRF